MGIYANFDETIDLIEKLFERQTCALSRVSMHTAVVRKTDNIKNNIASRIFKYWTHENPNSALVICGAV
jgi:hypothetical protein